jgi:hypothetical protein
MIEPSREQLIRRRDEINEQLNRVNRDERIELDNSSEEQAIQIEQGEVAVTMEANLRRELADIEDRLLDQSSSS